MMSLTIAMSIDYSLFLLTRYREEILRNRFEKDLCVQRMILYAGHVVAVSGCKQTIITTGIAMLSHLRFIITVICLF